MEGGSRWGELGRTQTPSRTGAWRRSSEAAPKVLTGAPEFRSCAQSFNGGVKTGKRVQERVCGRDWLQRRRRRSHHKSESAGRWGGSGSERRGGVQARQVQHRLISPRSSLTPPQDQPIYKHRSAEEIEIEHLKNLVSCRAHVPVDAPLGTAPLARLPSLRTTSTCTHQ